MKKIGIVLFVFLSSFFQPLCAQNINIGLFYKKEIKEVLFEPVKGKYFIRLGGKKIAKISSKRPVFLSIEGRKVKVFDGKGEIGLFDKLFIEKLPPRFWQRIFAKKKMDSLRIFRLKPTVPNLPAREYDDLLKVRVFNDNLLLVNDLDFSKYLAGVVEAETGANSILEFYKSQATICRTYALRNINKHKGEFYQLCDNVDCQAFKGRSAKNPDILKAVRATKNLIIIDKDSALIDAVFSANCGGQTMAVEDLWGVPKSYLKSTKDTFCIRTRQAKWEKQIPSNLWKKYLRKNGFQIPENMNNELLAFSQKNRKTHYKACGNKISLRTLRKNWKLRSTFFSVVPEKEQITLKGRGYGHGVGMCQEGAMNMAKHGFNFQEIIKFYYKDTKIIETNIMNYK